MGVHRDRRNGFELRYPDEWRIARGLLARVFRLGPVLSIRGPAGQVMNLVVGPVDQPRSFDVFRRSFQAYLSMIGHNEVRFGIFEIGGVEQYSAKYDRMNGMLAKKYSVVSPGGIELSFTALLGGNRDRTIDLDDPDVLQRETEYNQIIESLRFAA